MKPYFRDNNKVKEHTEGIFEKSANKKWAPNKNHHTIKTFIEATKKGIKDEPKTIRTCKYTNLSKKVQKALQELKHRRYCYNKH